MATVYFEIVNDTGTADELVSVWTPVADRAVISVPNWRGITMTMETVPAISIGAGRRLSLRPGAYQVDIVRLSRPFHPGQSIPLEVRFERAGRLEVSAVVINKMLPDHRTR